jgi:(2Fe-2S) ferredoxin
VSDTRSPNRSRVVVCRGCCCGTERKRPGVDHDGLLERLRAGVAGAAVVATSECLGPCSDANVVVVMPSPAARRGGARPVWLAGVLDEAATDAIAAWVGAGGPGGAAEPAALTAHVVAGPRPA